jgi:hypothetical protein
MLAKIMGATAAQKLINSGARTLEEIEQWFNFNSAFTPSKESLTEIQQALGE